MLEADLVLTSAGPNRLRGGRHRHPGGRAGGQTRARRPTPTWALTPASSSSGSAPLVDDAHIVAVVRRLLADAALRRRALRAAACIDGRSRRGADRPTASARCWRGCERRRLDTPQSRSRSPEHEPLRERRLPGGRGGGRQPQQLRRAGDRDGAAARPQAGALGDQVPALQGGRRSAVPELAEVLGRTRSAPTPSTRPSSSPTISTTAPTPRSPAACRELGIVFFATPFDLAGRRGPRARSAPRSTRSRAPTSPHRPLLEAVAATGKPLLLSTGAATRDEIRRAIEWTGLGPDRLVPLVCTLTYPTPDEDARLRPHRGVPARVRPLPVRRLRPHPGAGGGLDDGGARRRLHREALHARQAAAATSPTTR